MRVGFGCDHRGFAARELIVRMLKQMGHKCVDFGTDSPDPVDYPDIAYVVARAVAEARIDRAILVSGAAIGMPMAANKVKGIRATFCHDELSAHVARQHISANVLCLSADHTEGALMCRIVEVWLNTEAASGRHRRRVRKIGAIEEGRDPRGIE